MPPSTPLASLHPYAALPSPSRSPFQSSELLPRFADGTEEVEVLQDGAVNAQQQLGGSRSRPPSYFAYQPTAPLVPPEAPRQPLERGKSLPNLARRLSLKPSPRSQAMEETPRKQKSALGFSSLFSNRSGSTSSRKKSGPPAPLTLTNFLLPHPHAPAPSRRRDEEDHSPTAHVHSIDDFSPSRRRPSRPSHLQAPPQSARSAYAAMLTPTQQEQIEMEETLWAQLPVSAPPYRRWEGQRVELRRGSSAGDWEMELQEARSDDGRDEEGRRSGLDWRRGHSDTSLPFDISYPAAGSPTTSTVSPFLGSLRPTATPLDVLTPTRPTLVSAFSTETRIFLPTLPSSDTPPDSRPASFASQSSVAETPSINLRRPSVPDSPKSTRTDVYQRRIIEFPPPSPAQPPTSSSFPLPPTRQLFSSDESLSSDSHGSSWQGSSLEADGGIRMRTFESMSFSQIISQSLAEVETKPVPILGAAAGGVEASLRESGALEEFEQEVEFPWSGCGSLNGSGSGGRGSEDQGRRREQPLSREDWKQLEELIAEQTEEDEGSYKSRRKTSEGSRDSKKSRRKGMFVSPAASLSGLEAPASIDDYHTTNRGRIAPSTSSNSATSSESGQQHQNDHRIPLPRQSATSPSFSRHVAHPPRSPGIQPLHLLRRSAPRSPSTQSGFSQTATPSSTTEETAEQFKVPRQQGWKTGLDKLASLDGGSKVNRMPLVRRRSASAPESREQGHREVLAEWQETSTRSTSTQTAPSDLFIPPSHTNASLYASASTNDTRTSLGTLPNAESLFFSLPSSFQALPSPPLAPESLSTLNLSCTSPDSTSPDATAFDLDSSSTDYELELNSAVQSAEVVDVVRSPVGSPTLSRARDRGRGEVRSMARASLLPLRKSSSSSAPMEEVLAKVGGDEATMGQKGEEGAEVNMVKMLRERNRALEEEVQRLRAALGIESANSDESL
ncbi:hypothetical protein BCR35DRAFT_328395 [Leucosporidium creatinivorum]|uniref:Uncharacterized protein n=1 Tax=Leucosporidium creatinivorum TaxID=106004 RepID=A0A1Y2G543_9BASI|nr:hypothetical protein BCR35DRAFT_328395 [Leucosporidium creatinivorum]